MLNKMTPYFLKVFLFVFLVGTVVPTSYAAFCSADEEGLCGNSGGCGFARYRCEKKPLLPVYACVRDLSCGCTADTCDASIGEECNEQGQCCTGDDCLGDPVPIEIPDSNPYRGPIIWSLNDLLGPIIRILYYAGLFAGVGAIIYSGYLFITSAGEPHTLDNAKAWLSSAVFGILFIILTQVIINSIFTNLFGESIGF